MLWAAALTDEGRRRRIFYLAAGSLGWVAAQLSLSKAAFISGAVGFVLLFVFLLARGDKSSRPATLKLASAWLVLTIIFQAGFSFFSAVPATTQYITGSADATRETSSMRVFTWKVTGQMIADAPLLGVGADNFGARFNDGRRSYVKASSEDPANAIGEDYLFERAHNEYLQIFAELGTIGILLFAAIFGCLAWVTGRAVLSKVPLDPLLCGAIGGMAAFAVSSLFTSFSFRAAQNGIVFFLVMAVVNEAVWRNSTTDFWVGFKLWGALPATLVFAFANIPMLMRHGLQMDPAKVEATHPPSE